MKASQQPAFTNNQSAFLTQTFSHKKETKQGVKQTFKQTFIHGPQSQESKRTFMEHKSH